MKLDVKLSKPLMLAGEPVNELRFREPVAGDMRRLKLGSPTTIGDMLDMAAVLSGLPADAIDKLAPADVWEVVEALDPLFDRSPRTGPSS